MAHTLQDLRWVQRLRGATDVHAFDLTSDTTSPIQTP
jgi:hypothetical protein